MVVIFCYVICLGPATLAAQNFSLVLFWFTRTALSLPGGLGSETGQDLEGEISDNCPNLQTNVDAVMGVGVGKAFVQDYRINKEKVKITGVQ